MIWLKAVKPLFKIKPALTLSLLEDKLKNNSFIVPQEIREYVPQQLIINSRIVLEHLSREDQIHILIALINREKDETKRNKNINHLNSLFIDNDLNKFVHQINLTEICSSYSLRSAIADSKTIFKLRNIDVERFRKSKKIFIRLS